MQNSKYNETIQIYVEAKKEIYNALLSFLLNNDNFQDLFDLIELNKINKTKESLLSFIKLMLNIVNNHCRSPNLFNNIEKILNYIKSDIKQNFTNNEIFNIFKSNKLIVQVLLKNFILKLDKTILQLMLSEDTPDKTSYFYYFYPEIKPMIKGATQKKIESEILEINPNSLNDFYDKKKEGENDTFYCTLIRNDSVEDFVIYSNQANLPLSSTIPPSIFETNSFLIANKPTLIEYASFFGSIQIIKYLNFNGIELKPSLWIYAIHSNNAELINFLEENHVKPPEESYIECVKEAIKCHHNDIADYLLNFKVPNNQNNKEIIFKLGIMCSNYNYYQLDFNSCSLFFYLYLSDDEKLCQYYLKMKENSIRSIISNIKIKYKYPVDRIIEQSIDDKYVEVVYEILNEKNIFLKSETSKRLEKVIIPQSINEIYIKQFEKCSSLTSVIIPPTLQNISDHAFFECTQLKNVLISPKNYDFINDTSIFAYRNAIGECAFLGCTSLTTISIPSSIKIIEKGAFQNCSSLASISLPYFLSEIKSYAFDGCKSLVKMRIPLYVHAIGKYAFAGCSSLISISMSSSINTIAEHTFDGCFSLSKINIPSSITTIKTCAFKSCRSLKKISIPSSVTSIAQNLFIDCPIEQAEISSIHDKFYIGISHEAQITIS